MSENAAVLQKFKSRADANTHQVDYYRELETAVSHDTLRLSGNAFLGSSHGGPDEDMAVNNVDSSLFAQEPQRSRHGHA
jgi:hypothetical protein